MSEQKDVDCDGDAKVREIRASIAEGKMMLQVLRSLPNSENQTEVQSQLDALKEKQERIRCLLTQTAFNLQNESASSEQPGPSAQTENGVESMASELISQFGKLLSTGLSEGVVPEDTRFTTAAVSTDMSLLASKEPVAVATNEPSIQAEKPSSTELQAPNWTTKFASQVTKLTTFIDDTKRFESMVDRLLDITRRAQMNEASGFLNDILARFGELRHSFNSLRDSYEPLAEDSLMSEEMRDIQLASFEEFLNKLNQSLESTKDCFFTIYNLVKSSIEQGMADGTICTDEDENEVVEDQPEDLTANGIVAIRDLVPDADNELTGEDTGPVAAGKAYLAALRSQTKDEQDEIARLLQQRDELAGRLSLLRAAASAAQSLPSALGLNDVDDESNGAIEDHETIPTAAGDQAEDDDTSGINTPLQLGMQPALAAHLESKRQELEELKAQLNLLRKAEERVASFGSPDTTTPTIADASEAFTSRGAQGDRRSQRPSPPPISGKLKSRAQLHKLIPGELANGSSGMVPQKLETVTFQQPEAICINDSTERLYENMREARIRLEEQRGLVGAASAAVNRLNHGMSNNASKTLQNSLAASSGGVGAASVATSQDRTTLATWGGSSPVPSSSSVSSEAVQNEDDEVPSASSVSVAPYVSTKLTATSVGAASFNGTSNKLSANRARASTNGHSADHLLQVEDVLTNGIPVMPQLGLSPSPPPGRAQHTPRNRAQDVVDSNAWDDQRVQRLEAAVGQLYQICRCLVLENAQLSQIVQQLNSRTYGTPDVSSSQTTTTGLFGPPPVSVGSLHTGVQQWPTTGGNPWNQTPMSNESGMPQEQRLQHMFHHLMEQQQMNFLNLQAELQRQQYHQSAQATPALGHPAGPPSIASLLSPTASQPPSVHAFDHRTNGRSTPWMDNAGLGLPLSGTVAWPYLSPTSNPVSAAPRLFSASSNSQGLAANSNLYASLFPSHSSLIGVNNNARQSMPYGSALSMAAELLNQPSPWIPSQLDASHGLP